MLTMEDRFGKIEGLRVLIVATFSIQGWLGPTSLDSKRWGLT
jgi:hypothetical protein